jgi:hypothetical protein
MQLLGLSRETSEQGIGADHVYGHASSLFGDELTSDEDEFASFVLVANF